MKFLFREHERRPEHDDREARRAALPRAHGREGDEPEAEDDRGGELEAHRGGDRAEDEHAHEGLRARGHPPRGERVGLEHERRSLRLPVRECAWAFEDDALRLEFTLGRGAFATAVLHELLADAWDAGEGGED